MADAPNVQHTLLLVRHGEMGLKSPTVRRRLESRLTRRLEESLLHRSVEAIVRQRPARHFIETSDLDGASEAVRRTFGVTTFSPAAAGPSDLESVCRAAAAYAEAYWPEGAESFAIRPRRAGQHPFTSQDVGKQAGSAVWRAMQARGVPVRVDLNEPDFALHIEVRDRDAYLFHERFAGPGGLPLGSQGRMVLWLESPDAAAAAYLMMRRGADVYAYYLPQAVGTRFVSKAEADADRDAHPAVALHQRLVDWNAPRKLWAVWFDDEEMQQALGDGDTLPDGGVALARLGLQAGLRYARNVRAHAVVTGETVRSPWAPRLPETEPDDDLPILRPLFGLTRPLIDDFREVLDLPRLAGPRAEPGERAYTAGGRREGRRDSGDAPTEEAARWDPW